MQATSHNRVRWFSGLVVRGTDGRMSPRLLFPVVILLALSSLTCAACGGRIVVANDQFTVGGHRIWINGANTPWNSWNDFGGRFDYSWWDAKFQVLRDNGINAARVWITCNGEVGIVIDRNGQVSGATQAHWNDLDSLFQIARRHQIYVMATLMSFDHLRNYHPNYQSWRNWISSDSNIDSYVNSYLVPFVKRYADTPYLWSIDLMNEPDWVCENADNGRISWDRLQSYFARSARAIHESSSILVTVGIASLKYSSDTRAGLQGDKVSDRALQAKVHHSGARLDFYSVHYYDWIGDLWGNAFYMSPADYKMPTDKPNLIGEMPAAGTKNHTTTEDYEGAYQNGWQGAMGWTSDSADANLAQLGPATRTFRDNHAQLVYPQAPAGALAQPPSTIIDAGHGLH
jgi:hypothetical protein